MISVKDEKFLDAVAMRVAAAIADGKKFSKDLVADCMIDEINAQAKLMVEIEQGTRRGKAAEREMAQRLYKAMRSNTAD